MEKCVVACDRKPGSLLDALSHAIHMKHRYFEINHFHQRNQDAGQQVEAASFETPFSCQNFNM